MVLYRTRVRDNLNYFQTEQEAVDFAFRTITADKLANRHLIGFLNDKSLEWELLTELSRRGITYWKDEIPYGGWHNTSARNFVFGCDIRQVPASIGYSSVFMGPS